MILDAVAAYLAANSTALSVGVNLTKGYMPDTPDTVMTVFETGGYPPTHYLSTGSQTRVYENPSVMIHCRSVDYQTGRDRIDEAYTILDGVNNRGLPTTTGTHYVEIGAVQSPFHLGRDGNDRHLFSVNFDVTKTTG